MKIGCIGQGYVGKNIADDFEARNFDVVRYSLEAEYKNNAELIKDCDVVFIGVPTPSTPKGFDSSVVESALSLVGSGKTAVLKSTVLPGTTSRLQSIYPDIHILFSPEFLCEATAAYDVANPILNVVGYNKENTGQKSAAEAVMTILPKCEKNHIVSIESAELFKYAHNLNGYFRVVLSNLLFDAGEKVGAQWDEVSKIMDGDVMMSPYYNQPVHKGGRGAGGNCFVKDMAAFRFLYESLQADDTSGINVLKALEKKNIELLRSTGKSEDIITGVYGK